MAITGEHPASPYEEVVDPRVRRAQRSRIVGYAALVVSAVVAGLGLLWLVAPESNPFAAGAILHSESALLQPDALAAAALLTGLVGAVLALPTAGRASPPGVVMPLGWASGVLAVVMATVFGSVSFIAGAGYLFGLGAVIAGIATIVVMLFRAPRMGLALLAGLAAVLAASVWLAGVTLDGIVDFAMAFGESLGADAPGLLVAGVLVAAILTSTAQAVMAVHGSRAGRAFEDWLVRHRRAITVLAALGPLPYAVARATWLTPWPLFAPTTEMGPDMLATGIMLGSGAVAAVILTLGLILPWGVRFPRWMPRIGGREVPTALAVVPGLLAAATLCISAVPMLVMFGTGAGSVIDGVLLNLVLPLWFWGPMLALAVWAYAAWRATAKRDAAWRLTAERDALPGRSHPTG
jgi:hypothetical protein